MILLILLVIIILFMIFTPPRATSFYCIPRVNFQQVHREQFLNK